MNSQLRWTTWQQTGTIKNSRISPRCNGRGADAIFSRRHLCCFLFRLLMPNFPARRPARPLLFSWSLAMTIENTIRIEASPEVVWAVTEDIERWPEWTPTVTAVRPLSDSPFGLGTVARIKQPGQPESDWTVTEYVHQDRFTWKTQRIGLRMAASHQVQEEAAGTLNTLRLQASGVIASILWPVLRVVIRRTLRKENRGLKARCEAISASSPPS